MNFTENQDYANAAPSVKKMRDCIEGEPTVKREGTIYLKNPDTVDITSTQAQERYARFKDGAEFHGYSGETEKQMLGKMRTGEIEIELPDAISYLTDNMDGDGMPLAGQAELLYKNLLEVKWHILLAEMDSLAGTVGDGVDSSKLSQADIDALDMRASVKSYRRESVIDWDFRRVSGAMQLSLLVVKQCSSLRDEDYNIKQIVTYLVFALDDNGDYYQRKFVAEGETNNYVGGEPIYPKISGRNIKWIPAEIVVDEESPAGIMPKGLGYLYPIACADIHRYNISARYAEALSMLQPTIFTSGWRQGGQDHFKELNGGREGIVLGSSMTNNLPEGVNVEVVSMGAEGNQFLEYFEWNTKNIKGLGGSVNDGSESTGNRSATEAAINSRDRTAVMESIVSNVEDSLKRVISYCGMFMGIYSADDISGAVDSIELKLPREFGKAKISPDERSAIVNEVMSGIISKDEGIRQLVQGGVTVQDAESIAAELEMSVAAPISASNDDSQEVFAEEE